MKKVNVVYTLIYDEINKSVLMVQNENEVWTLPGGAALRK